MKTIVIAQMTWTDVVNENLEVLVTNLVRIRQRSHKHYPYVVEERSRWLPEFGGWEAWERLDEFETEADAKAYYDDHTQTLNESFPEWAEERKGVVA